MRNNSANGQEYMDEKSLIVDVLCSFREVLLLSYYKSTLVA